MKESTHFLQNGSPPWLALEFISNLENYQDHVENPMSETNESASLTSQPQNHSSPNNIGSNHENINSLEAQLQSLRIDSGVEGLFHGNSTNQQTQVGNNTTDQSQVRNSGVIEPSHVHNEPLHENNMNQQSVVGNFGIGPSYAHERLLHGNKITQQSQVWNSRTVPSQFYNTNYQQALVGNFGVGTSHACNSSSLMRQRCSNMTPSLEVLRGRVVSMSKEEDGSKFLVRVLDGQNHEDIEFISKEVVDHLHDLMMDTFGKRVVEKIFDVLDVYHRTLLFELITMNPSKFQGVCGNNIGCIAVQSMIDHITTEREMNVFTCALKQIAFSLATSQYGSYVLQHFLKHFRHPFSKAILDAMADECIYIATHKTGCSVLQRCLSIATPESCFLLILMVSDRVSVLAPDRYGNYVVQYVIKLMVPPINEAMVNRLQGRYVELSINQYASNVVEHLLQFSTQENVDIIVQEIINSPSFLNLLQDPYGNYVAQTALKCSKGTLYDALVSSILRHYRNLCADQYGKRVLEFMHGGGKFHPQIRRH